MSDEQAAYQAGYAEGQSMVQQGVSDPTTQSVSTPSEYSAYDHAYQQGYIDGAEAALGGTPAQSAGAPSPSPTPTPSPTPSSSSSDGVQELTLSAALHFVGEVTLHAGGALLAILIDVITIPGDVQLKPADPPPANPTSTGPYYAACSSEGHTDGSDPQILNNGMWWCPTAFNSAGDAQAKCQDHGQNHCPDNGSNTAVIAVSQVQSSSSN